ncbi:MAG TPA: glutathione S-transferase family protein [Burkholderiales bacterium]|nr:glutathione S-transferase family protein [Burkholderiales bacterium]
MLTFYYGSGSPYSWRVWFALEHKGIPYELKQLSFSAGDLKRPDYLRVNPRGKVPAIEDDGFSLYESAAIVEYLDERYGPKGVLFPGGAGQRAQVRRLVREADEYVAGAQERLVDEVLFKKKEQWDGAEIAAARDSLVAELNIFEAYLAGEFLADALSAADFTLYPMIALCLRIEKRNPDLALRGAIGPKLAAWMKRVEALPYFEKTYPPHWKA